MQNKISEAISVLNATNEVSLGTIESTHPFVSTTGFITLPAERAEQLPRIFVLLSDLARHAKNIKMNECVSLLMIENKPELSVHEKKRMTLKSQMKLVEDDKLFMKLKLKYMDVFPRSEIFFTLSDFRFYEAKVDEIHWIGGFGEAATWKMSTNEGQ